MDTSVVSTQLRDSLVATRAALFSYGHDWDVADALEGAMDALEPLLEELEGYGYEVRTRAGKLTLVAVRDERAPRDLPSCGHYVLNIPQPRVDCVDCSTYVLRRSALGAEPTNGQAD